MKRFANVVLCVLAVVGTSACRNAGSKASGDGVVGNETEIVEPAADVAEVTECDEAEVADVEDVEEEKVETGEYAWVGKIGDEQISLWVSRRMSDGLCIGETDDKSYFIVGKMFKDGYVQLTFYDNVTVKGVISGDLSPEGALKGEWTNYRGDDRPATLNPAGVSINAYYPFYHPKFESIVSPTRYAERQWDDTYNRVDVITGEKPKMAFRLHAPFTSDEVITTIEEGSDSWEGAPYEDGKLVYAFSENENLVFEFFEHFVNVTSEWVGEGDGYRQAEAFGMGSYIWDADYNDTPDW